MDDVLAKIKENIVRLVLHIHVVVWKYSGNDLCAYTCSSIQQVSVSCSSAPVLNAVMNNFKPEYVAQKAVMFAEMVKDCEETGLPKV